VALNPRSFVKGSTALYDRIGDVNAFALVQQHFEQLQRVTTRHGGAIIKSIGDAIMVAFVDPADAVPAAIDLRREIAAFDLRQPDRALIRKIGVHWGAAITVTLNDRLDCFGQTVNIAARVQNLADADEICISGDAYDAVGVKEKQRAPAWARRSPQSKPAGRPPGAPGSASSTRQRAGRRRRASTATATSACSHPTHPCAPLLATRLFGSKRRA
jgi:class 3 adenylate cyclase